MRQSGRLAPSGSIVANTYSSTSKTRFKLNPRGSRCSNTWTAAGSSANSGHVIFQTLGDRTAPWAIRPAKTPEAQVASSAWDQKAVQLLQRNFLQERCANNIAIVFQHLPAKLLQTLFVAIYQFGPFNSRRE